MNLYNEHFPKVRKYISAKRLHKPWLTQDILNSIKQKCNLFKMQKLGIIDHQVHMQYRNNLTQYIRTAKISYYRGIYNNFRSNTKKIWETINELRDKQQLKTKTSSLHYNGHYIDNPEDIAEAFNEHFTNVAIHLNRLLPSPDSNIPDYLQGNFLNSMFIPPVSPHQISKYTMALNKKSNINDLSVSVLKRNADQFSIPLSLLFNHSISTGKFPTPLKVANITPIYKSGPKDNPSNYRPISSVMLSLDSDQD